MPRLCIPRQETGLASEEASAEGEADNPNDEIPGPDEDYAKPYLEQPGPYKFYVRVYNNNLQKSRLW